MGNLESVIYNNLFWVAEDTPYTLPAMNVNPNTITVSGFSGGSGYANILHIVHSKTIKASGLKCGPAYSFGYKLSGGKEVKTEDIQGAIDLVKKYSDEGLIDDVSNLKNAPVTIGACGKDE